jgi:hypothetical protein
MPDPAIGTAKRLGNRFSSAVITLAAMTLLNPAAGGAGWRGHEQSGPPLPAVGHSRLTKSADSGICGMDSPDQKSDGASMHG